MLDESEEISPANDPSTMSVTLEYRSSWSAVTAKMMLVWESLARLFTCNNSDICG